MLGVDAAFDRMAAHFDRTKDDVAKLFAIRNANLRLHQVHSGDHLSYRMLHLNARVHLDKVEASIFIHEELDGAGILVAEVAKADLKFVAYLLPQLGSDASRWLF